MLLFDTPRNLHVHMYAHNWLIWEKCSPIEKCMDQKREELFEPPGYLSTLVTLSKSLTLSGICFLTFNMQLIMTFWSEHQINNVWERAL